MGLNLRLRRDVFRTIMDAMYKGKYLPQLTPLSWQTKFLSPLNNYSFFLVLSILLCMPVGIGFSQDQQSLSASILSPTADTPPTFISKPESQLENLDITVGTQGPDSKALIAGQDFEWEIQVRWYGISSEIKPEVQVTPSFTGMQLMQSSTTLRTGVEEDRAYSEKVFRYRLRPLSDGQLTIGAATIRYTQGDDGKENFLTTTPSTFRVKPAPFSIRQWLAEKWQSAWFRGIILVPILGLIICVTLWIRRRYKKATPQEISEPVNPVEEFLEEARRRRIEGDRSRFVRSLKQAVFLSMSQRFPDVDSQDIRAYRERLNTEMQFVFDRFSDECEHIQFAPVSLSPDEMDRVWEDARRLTES